MYTFPTQDVIKKLVWRLADLFHQQAESDTMARVDGRNLHAHYWGILTDGNRASCPASDGTALTSTLVGNGSSVFPPPRCPWVHLPDAVHGLARFWRATTTHT